MAYTSPISRNGGTYHYGPEQVQQLWMTKLNNSRKLLGEATALEDHKQWMLAVASGRVDRVVPLVRASLIHRVIRILICEQ